MVKASSIEKVLARYWATAAAYTSVRRMADLWDATLPCETSTTKGARRPMLLGTKLGIWCISVVYSPAIAPFYVVKDLNKLDCWMQGMNPEDVGITKPDSVHAHIFS